MDCRFGPICFNKKTAMSAVSADIFQAYAKPLLVKPGGTVTVTTNFVVDKLPTGAITTGVTINSDKVTINSARIFPNTWKPKQKANITAAVAGLWTLPTVGLVLDKEYKITYKFRVGKAFNSGDLIGLTSYYRSSNLGPITGNLTVQVK